MCADRLVRSGGLRRRAKGNSGRTPNPITAALGTRLIATDSRLAGLSVQLAAGISRV